MSRIDGLLEDNKSLEHEIKQLQLRKTELMKQLEKAKQKRPLGDSFEQLKKILESPTKKSSPMKKNPHTDDPKMSQQARKRQKRFEEEYVAAEPIQHEFFDDSISKYFTKPKRRTRDDSELDTNDEEKMNNVILENVYRMFGITAFPVKDPSRSGGHNEPELLGIRIEVFNELDLKFETPHYLILEKNQKNGKWIIFKHTVPAFVQIDQLASEYDGLEDTELLKFLKVVRNVLNRTCHKHQVMESIKKDLRKNVRQVQKDIAMENVKFTLLIDDKESHVVMKCALESVESCFIEGGFTASECDRMGRVLKGDFKMLKTRLESVIRSMSDD